MIFTNQPRFVIKGEISILYSVWDISRLTPNSEHILFSLENGTFKCENLTVNSFTNNYLRFLKSTKTSSVSCIKLNFEGIKTDVTKSHFTFIDDESNFTNSV